MFFNEKKFEHLAISTTTRDVVFQTPTGLPIEKKPTILPIEKKPTIRDLGIHFQDDLGFNQHITTITAKGTRLAGWVDRSFKFRTKPLMHFLLKHLIVPQMEYGCVICTHDLSNKQP